MKAKIEKENGREVYKRSDKTETWVKIKIGIFSFIAGVTLTLMFYPIIRP